MSSPLRGIGLRQTQTATTTKREIGKEYHEDVVGWCRFRDSRGFLLWMIQSLSIYFPRM
jgi:hypothetical protein